jgi:hypothetical protein
LECGGLCRRAEAEASALQNEAIFVVKPYYVLPFGEDCLSAGSTFFGDSTRVLYSPSPLAEYLTFLGRLFRLDKRAITDYNKRDREEGAMEEEQCAWPFGDV